MEALFMVNDNIMGMERSVMFDFIFKNGHVIDSFLGIDKVTDIAVTGDTIAEIGDLKSAEARQIVDASGCYVTPGLIDYHAHINYGSTDNSFRAELGCFPNGVTTVVDGGTCGVGGFENFYNTIVSNSQLTIKSYLNIGSIGQTSHLCPEELDPECFETEKILHYCKKYRDNIVGIKLRLGAPMVKGHGIEALKATIKVARAADLRLTVHMIDCPIPVKEVLNLLSPGYIYCHVFHDTGAGTILDENGKLLQEVMEAQKRGILFDVSHGRGGASLRIAKAALDQGFKPDIITADLSRFSLYRKPAYSLNYIMSEFLHLGFSFRDLIQIYTDLPSRLIYGSSEGFLKVGAAADIAVFRVIEKPVQFVDYLGETLAGNQMIKCEMTLKNGEPVFRQSDFI